MVRGMPRLLALAAMLALAPTLALAQEGKDEHKGPPHPAAGGPPHPPPPHPGPPPGGPPHPAFKPPPHPGPIGGPPPHPPGPIGGPPPHPPGGPEFAHPGGPPPGGPAFAHPGGPPPGGPQFSYHGRPFNRVHINPFIYPQGWAYRQWAVGAFLPPLFLAPEYYYPDWAALGLAPPPPGFQWVRYGPDLLLVELDNGQVVDVAYGVFYE